VSVTLLLSFGLKMVEFSSDQNKENINFSKESLSFGLLASGLSVLVVGILFIVKAGLSISPKDVEHLEIVKTVFKKERHAISSSSPPTNLNKGTKHDIELT